MADELRKMTITFKDGSTIQYQIAQAELSRLGEEFRKNPSVGAGFYKVLNDAGEDRLLILQYGEVRYIG